MTKEPVSEGRIAVTDEAASELEQSPSGADSFRVALPNFEGPLDLLLHLIREHRVDIFDIPIALITEKYLDHLARMKEVNLDIAGEFLVMASTLAHIKSRLLLPRQEVQAQVTEEQAEQQADPRAELVKRLLEYQKYREAAEQLAKQDILDRDVFTRKVVPDQIPIPEEEVGLMEISVYKLIEGLDRVMAKLVPKKQHEVVLERVSLSEAIRNIAAVLREKGQATFFSFFEGQRTRQQVVITFLAMLEMTKLKLIRIFQPEGQDDILLTPKGEALANVNLEAPEVDESEYK